MIGHGAPPPTSPVSGPNWKSAYFRMRPIDRDLIRGTPYRVYRVGSEGPFVGIPVEIDGAEDQGHP
jgi:hypothetical protein